jgi:hypothetical protein
VADPVRPFRLLALDALSAALEEIEAGETYVNSLAGKVFRGRAHFGTNDPVPMVSILEDPRLTELVDGPDGAAVRAGEWHLILQGFVEDDNVHPTDPAHVLLADVVARLNLLIASGGGSTRNLLGLGEKKPCVTGMRLGGSCVRPPDEISAKAYFVLSLKLTLVE